MNKSKSKIEQINNEEIVEVIRDEENTKERKCHN